MLCLFLFSCRFFTVWPAVERATVFFFFRVTGGLRVYGNPVRLSGGYAGQTRIFFFFCYVVFVFNFLHLSFRMCIFCIFACFILLPSRDVYIQLMRLNRRGGPV